MKQKLKGPISITIGGKKGEEDVPIFVGKATKVTLTTNMEVPDISACDFRKLSVVRGTMNITLHANLLELITTPARKGRKRK